MQGGYQVVAVQFLVFWVFLVCCYVVSMVFWLQFLVNFENQDYVLTIQHYASLVISENRLCLQLNGVVTTAGPC